MAVPTTPYTDIPDSKIDAESPYVEEIPTHDRDNLQRLYEIVLGNGVDPGDVIIQAGPLPTGGGLPAVTFAQPAFHPNVLDVPATYPWIEPYVRDNIWIPYGASGIHIKGDLTRTGSGGSASYFQFKMQIIGPGGTDESNVLETLHGPGTLSGEVFDLLLSNDNMNAEVTHKILARMIKTDGFPVDASFNPDFPAYELWQHFGQV